MGFAYCLETLAPEPEVAFKLYCVLPFLLEYMVVVGCWVNENKFVGFTENDMVKMLSRGFAELISGKQKI